MPASQHMIAGTVLTMPVKVRKADQHIAMFSVDAEALQRLIDYSGMQVYCYLPGRAVLSLILTRFADCDLGAYHEFSTCVTVNPPGTNAPGLRSLQSAFVQHMLVDQAFTLEAGRTIWGFPKVMADFTVRDVDQFGFDVSIGGQLVVGMEFRPGLPIPSAFTSREQLLRTYSHRDGLALETPVSDVADWCALSTGRCPTVAGRSPIRQGARVAGLAQARAGLQFGWQRGDVVRRRASSALTEVSCDDDQAGCGSDRRQLLRR